ncbi:MAG TPA: hypothetical protein VGQ25_04545 [Gemmatimonadales bacterium]|jgi:hypothetical protein|nr:hypothetical protein [Gemmatimonadales bacterium]
MLSRLSRRAAPLLLALFVTGGGASTALDAVLYHSRAHAGDILRTHFDPAGGCGAHQERCVLTRSVSETRLLAVLPPALAWASTAVTAPSAQGPGRFGSIELHTLSCPRAPPPSV